jgi:hypothetical protein
VSEAGLAAKLEKITQRLAADAPGMERPGADLIAFYLAPDRHPAGRAWSRKHADTQRRLRRAARPRRRPGPTDRGCPARSRVSTDHAIIVIAHEPMMTGQASGAGTRRFWLQAAVQLPGGAVRLGIRL